MTTGGEANIMRRHNVRIGRGIKRKLLHIVDQWQEGRGGQVNYGNQI